MRTVKGLALAGLAAFVLALVSTMIGQQASLTVQDQQGTTLPATCSVGQRFFDTDATAGQNSYACTAANTWTLQGDGTGGSSGLTLVQQVTASSSSSVDFTGCISSTYDTYKLELIGVKPATDNTNLYFRVSTDGGATYDSGANYGWAQLRWRAAAGTTTTTGAESGATQVEITTLGVDSAANPQGVSGWMELYNPAATTHKQVLGEVTFFGDTDQFHLGIHLRATYLSTTAYTAFQFIEASGNIASGTFRCYGLAK